MGQKTIAIIGAGAKAAAIVARAATLRDLGKKIPEIVVFEERHIGSAWSGQSGFSSGFLTLCTPGEKDVGFPYHEEAISPALFARFSWSTYLVATRWIAEWVDRGRNHPDHSRWADYLRWVFDQAKQDPVIAKVTSVTPDAGQWQISYNESGVPRTMLVDGVVLTGTGRSKTVPAAGNVPDERALNAETFWLALDDMNALDQKTIIVVGDGGAAGTIVAWLADRYAERRISIIAVNPMGTLFPRGDGYAERRWFSDPSDWPDLELKHRRTLLERTEAGVVSLRNKHLIDTAANVEYRWGRATNIRWEADPDDERVIVDIEYDGNRRPSVAGHYVVSAIGFDSWSLLDLVKHPAVSPLIAPASVAQRKKVESEITSELALPMNLGLPTGLHVPGLAGLARGPGMGNLGCLGLMASHILTPYVLD